MSHTSRIELSRSALKRNIRFLRRRLDRRVKLTSVVKGNAYGHGLEVFVRLAEDSGVRSFAVFSADEALVVRRSMTQENDIVIMGAIDRPQLEWAVETGVSFYVFDLGRLEAAVEAARSVGVPARIHLELETGLNRLGFERRELEAAARMISDSSENLSVEGVCTHYAGAESVSNYLRIRQQIDAFRESARWLEEVGITAKHRHTACSAAALVYPDTIMDMVRIGIAQYGYWPSKEIQMRVALEHEEVSRKRWYDPLRRVISWKSEVMAVKEVPAGEFVGYGTTYLTNAPKKIAIVPVGYASGFARRLSNFGRVLIRGRRFAVIGVVNMNMMTVDVTNHKAVSPGDEVVLIGRQNKNQITVASFSEMAQYLNYEMLVRLPSEIPRVVVD